VDKRTGTKHTGIKNIGTKHTGIKHVGTKRIGPKRIGTRSYREQNESADKAYRQTKRICKHNVPVDKKYRQRKSIWLKIMYNPKVHWR
jgi:hypothetical protein